MAVRLQMKLGYAADAARLPGSPDAILSEEPTIGSVVRSKGSLYLIVTARTSGPRVGEATRMVAEAIRDAYYYDESAGIVVCLEKAIRAANKKILHQRDRLGGDKSDEANGPLGVGLAVVRGNELYVVTVGPAEAFLVRQARLSTLPDPNRARGLPSNDLEPSVWRGEINVGDSLVIASENLVARLGPDDLKDALLTLHPQSAMEQLQARFRGRRRHRQRRGDRDRGNRSLGNDPPAPPRAGPRPGAAGRRARPLADPARRQRLGRGQLDPGNGRPSDCRGGRRGRPRLRPGSRPAAPATARPAHGDAGFEPGRDPAPGGDRRARLRRPGPRPGLRDLARELLQEHPRRPAPRSPPPSARSRPPRATWPR